MNRREFLSSIIKLSALSVIPFPLPGEPATEPQTGRRNFHGLSLPALGLAPGRAACAAHSVHGIGNRSA